MTSRERVLREIGCHPGILFNDLITRLNIGTIELSGCLVALVSDGSIMREHVFGGWSYYALKPLICLGVDIDAIHVTTKTGPCEPVWRARFNTSDFGIIKID